MPDERLNLPFTGLVSFMRVPTCPDLDRLDPAAADIAILGAPTDEGSPWKPGARFAPRKIRELSVKYAGYGPVQRQLGYYDIEEDRRYLEYERRHRRIMDCGDSDIVYTNVERTFANITGDVGKILAAGVFPVVVGGDHAITYPVVRAYRERLNIVHFDAHLDYRPFVHGVQWANGNPIRNVAQLRHCHHIVQVGIRSLRTSQSDVADSRARGNDIVTVPALRRDGPGSVVDRLPAGEPAYVSIDIDVLDLPLVPGCASAEVNGLAYDELRQTLFAIARDREVIGFDLVEVNPMLDVASDNTSQLAAQLIIEFLARIVEHPAYRRRHPRRAGVPAGTPRPIPAAAPDGQRPRAAHARLRARPRTRRAR
jgi:agmatinase